MGRRDLTVAEVENPPVRRRELGALLRALRSDAGMTVEEVAERLLCSATKISRMETGQRSASQRDVRDLCQIYGVTDPAHYDHLMSLARLGRGQAWWQPYNLPHATMIGLETEAISISDFEPGVIPGLLQTADYARAIHEHTLERLSPAMIGQRLEVLRNRQEIIARGDPPHLHAIIDEAVLHRAIGGPAVMAAQLERVIEAATNMANVTVQLLPYSVGAHPALDSTFILLEMADPVPTVVYVEGLLGQFYLERPQDVHRYAEAFEHLRQISLSPESTINAINMVKFSYSREGV